MNNVTQYLLHLEKILRCLDTAKKCWWREKKSCITLSWMKPWSHLSFFTRLKNILIKFCNGEYKENALASQASSKVVLMRLWSKKGFGDTSLHIGWFKYLWHFPRLAALEMREKIFEHLIWSEMHLQLVNPLVPTPLSLKEWDFSLCSLPPLYSLTCLGGNLSLYNITPPKNSNPFTSQGKIWIRTNMHPVP